MKKYIWVNFIGVFVLFNIVVFLISCATINDVGKQLGMTGTGTPDKNITAAEPAKFTPEIVKAAIEYAAQKFPKGQREEFLKESPLNELYEATGELNSSMKHGRIKVSEISPAALGELIYEQAKKGYGSGYLARINRIKCMDNLRNVGKAGLAFAQDNGGRLPWQLTPIGVRTHFDPDVMASDYARAINQASNELGAHPNSLAAAGVYGLVAMKAELVTPKILHSPCDYARSAASAKVQENWKLYDTKAKGVSAELGNGSSYVLCRGADSYRPYTVYALTRNWSGDRLDAGKWLGFDSDPVNPRTMFGLMASQGQVALMDGSVKQSTDTDLGVDGPITKRAYNSLGGLAKGRTSMNLIRGPGL